MHLILQEQAVGTLQRGKRQRDERTDQDQEPQLRPLEGELQAIPTQGAGRLTC